VVTFPVLNFFSFKFKICKGNKKKIGNYIIIRYFFLFSQFNIIRKRKVWEKGA
jgi:hypothetical protein